MEVCSKSECNVCGSLALFLFVSSYLGIAPIRLTKRGDGWRVRMSPFMCLYSYALITIIDISIVLASIAYYHDALASSRTNSYMKRAVWIFDVTTLTIMTTLIVYTAPKKTQQFIKYYGKLQKINEWLKTYQPRNLKKNNYIFFSVYILIGFIIIVFDYSSNVLQSSFIKTATEDGLLWCYYLSYIILLFVQMQFILITWHAYNTFEGISQGLGKLLLEKQKAEMLNVENFNTTSNKCIIKSSNTVPLQLVNNLTDRIGFIEIKPKHFIQNTPLQTSEIIRRLALSYCDLCDVVHDIDNSFGFTLLLLLCSFLLHLVVTPYNLIMSFSGVDVAQLSQLYKYLCLQLGWCIFHTSNLITVVEPCHRTIIEVETIRELVSKLMRSSSITDDRDFTELDLFYKHLLLNDVYYAPLNVFTLNRALIATIMSSITTYLVILIQI